MEASNIVWNYGVTMKRIIYVLCIAAAAGASALSAAMAEQERPFCANGRESQSAVDRKAEMRSPSLSATLDRCNGVLKPPRVGDSEMTHDPPDIGKTRIIRPDVNNDQS
jgi:hypothetical protein